MAEGKRQFRWGVPLIVLVIAAMSAATVLWQSQQGNDEAALACAATNEKLPMLDPLARGDLAAFTVPERSRLIPDVGFTDKDGAQRTLSEWKGKMVLLNLWATWCAPCRREMPALDRLQATLGSDKFEVVAVSIDADNTEKPLAFLDEIKVTDLQFYADPSTEIFKKLKAIGRAPGMPSTILIDEAGCELGFLAGPAEWDSPDAMAIIQAAMKEK